MPLYGYRCTYCKREFTEMKPIVERNDPTKQECTNCRNKTIKRLLESPMIVSTVMTNLKPPDGFKDVLKNIKKNSGRQSTIDV